MTLIQAAITRNVGGTVDYSKAALGTGTANISTTTINVNGILGGAITFGRNDWSCRQRQWKRDFHFSLQRIYNYYRSFWVGGGQ